MNEILKKLHSLALKKSTPYCYTCYKLCPSGTCPSCHSDDLMRHVDGVGSEYGTEWIVDDILSDLDELHTDSMFDDQLRELYGDTVQVGWLTVDLVDTIKEHEIDYRCALADFESELHDDESLFEHKGIFYSIDDLDDLFEQNDISDDHEG